MISYYLTIYRDAFERNSLQVSLKSTILRRVRRIWAIFFAEGNLRTGMDMSDQEDRKENIEKNVVEEQGNLDMERSSAIHFMQEKMKERPVNRRKLVRRTIITV